MADQSISINMPSLEDEEETLGKNGKPAIAKLFQKFADLLNWRQYGGRIIGAFWGGSSATNSNHVKRFLWNHHHAPGTKVRTHLLILKPNGARVSGQGVRTSIDGVATDYFADYNLQSVTARSAPTGLEAFQTADTSTSVSRVATYSLGSLTANGPGLIAGLLYESAQSAVDPSTTNGFTPAVFLGPGFDQVTAGPGGTKEILDTIRQNFLHCWNRKRPTLVWSHNTPSASSSLGFSTSTQSFRYIFDQTVGDGGTAPSTTGPGITFPLPYAARGLNTSVSVAVYVYAAMSGTDDVGAIGISHKSTSTTMTTIATLTNPPTIGPGTTFQWYPSETTTIPSTVALRTDVDYERLLLCARATTSIGGDYVRIGAFVIFPMPSTTIT